MTNGASLVLHPAQGVPARQVAYHALTLPLDFLICLPAFSLPLCIFLVLP